MRPQPQPHHQIRDSLAHSTVETIIDYSEPQQVEAREARDNYRWYDVRRLSPSLDVAATHADYTIDYGDVYLRVVAHASGNVDRAAADMLNDQELVLIGRTVGYDILFNMIHIAQEHNRLLLHVDE